MKKVLVSDDLSEFGIIIFQETEGIEVDVKSGLSPAVLKSIIGKYDALVIRSATKVTEDLLDAAKKELSLITGQWSAVGRAKKSISSF